jgi:hypothetical protein
MHLEDKLKKEINNSNWEDIMRRAIDEEPTNFFKLKELDIYDYIKNEKDAFLEEYKDLNRGGKSRF